ncbi:MAG: GDSL-type esterase/lipase family protein [Clostridiales Family XIII bacterium]|jgi:lysophospholipase L1-like esterase|nr:GDSL-type esterase/lipase family protein [Clostridiales Family XIII bacterium]
MYPWLIYNKGKKKKAKPGKLVLIFSFVFITLGLSLFLCADRTGEPEKDVLLSKAPRETASAEGPSLPAEEAEAEAALSPEPSTPSVQAPAAIPPPAAAQEAPAPAAVAEASAPEAGAPPSGDEAPLGGRLPSATMSAPADSAEKTAGEAASEAPPPGAVDVSETDDYFSDALFIGDSRTQGLLLYSNLGNASYYAARGLTVEHVFEKRVVEIDGGKRTVSDALERRAFGKVYLMFGLNELGWNSAEKFIETYGRVIDRVRETQPDAVLYVQAIMPVSAQKSQKDPVHNNPNIDRFNEMILNLAEAKGAIYLNVGESVSDGNGVLPEEASSDGIHLNKKYCIKWEEYLRAHEV